MKKRIRIGEKDIVREKFIKNRMKKFGKERAEKFLEFYKTDPKEVEGLINLYGYIRT